MLNLIDNFLNRITMYSLMLWFLRILVGLALVLSLIGILPFSPLAIIFEFLVLIIGCWIFNQLFAKILKVPSNFESYAITGLILSLIITPQIGWQAFWFYLLGAFVSQTSKYVLAIRGKHIFNPAAFAVAVTFFAIGQGASWWVGNVYLLLAVVIGGLLIVRKIQRFDLVLSFFLTYLAVIVLSSSQTNLVLILKTTLLYSPILFFAFVMLTEPTTTPSTRLRRIIYGVAVGLLFLPSLKIGSIYATPELALLAANILSFVLSPKLRSVLTFVSKEKIAADTFDFAFMPNRKLAFEPGQYLEYTVGHERPDNRGNRRYFTIASSPTEQELHLGIKFYEKPSSFKKTLVDLTSGAKVLAGQLAGDFTLPKDVGKKLVFIAGGIGITPFRSMVKYLLDSNEKRDIVLFYSCKNESEVAYKQIFNEASEKLGIKVVYVLTETMGYLDDKKIKSAAPDFLDRKFYISGPRGMVTAFEKTLKNMGVPRTQIKTDFFPGYV